MLHSTKTVNTLKNKNHNKCHIIEKWGINHLNEDITTELKDNWATFFFECPTLDFKRILTDLFSLLDDTTEAQIPHFLIREYSLTKKIGVSLRILREPNKSTEVENALCTFFEKNKLKYQNEPEGNRHAWLRRGQIDKSWNKKRCEAIHQLSKFVVFMANNDLFDTSSRCLNAHYLINMLALQEATVPQSNQVLFLDIIEGKAPGFHTLPLKP
jgi:hypothetical protein